MDVRVILEELYARGKIPGNQAVAIVSGGLDSTVLAYMMAAEGVALHLLSFDYGQRHRKELERAVLVADWLDASHEIVDLSALRCILSGSALTDNVAVPEGHYTDESMKATVVPNRNAIMLSIAYGYAVARGIDCVAFGAHQGDHPIYPDCRLSFVRAFDTMEQVATGNMTIRLYAPFVERTKADIVKIGAELGVPFEHTWSCYKGGHVHCGLCGTCQERKEAFTLAGVQDPTEYLC